ncbi:outer membrane beta-barrel protein [Brevundimonas bacteroides]|uniref:outer membrane beta-barrel protein n=1 Tax=Brevundimonas bacteroides TaxID=74311 RepID=UPI0004958789|nr:outer membrane beta-barrel protein [Brevundimonas bacteroides]
MPNRALRLSCMLALGVAVTAQSVQAQSTSGSLAQAQNQAGNLFARDRGTGVRERPRPEYEALGVPVGTFTAYPSLQLDAESNDNIFATRTGTQDDWIFRLKPEISLESGWSRHALALFARANIARYQDFDEENFEDWGIGANGRLDFTRATNLALGVDYASLTEPRSSSNAPASTIEPISYDITSAYAAGTTVRGRTKLSARADVRTFDYEDGRTAGGVVIDQDNRDRTITSLTGRGDYAVSPATALFVQATVNTRDYDTATSALLPARDSDGYEILAGANFELGAVARGEVAVGYISQEFDAAVYDKIDGFGARGQLEWFPTQLTTVTGTASRTVEDSGIAGSGGYLSTAVGVRIDHELLRNVLLNADISLSSDDYQGLDREDERLQYGIGGTYLLNRNLGLSLAASHFEQTSDGAAAGVDFDVNRLTLTLVAQF